jgi:hypothetical protein
MDDRTITESQHDFDADEPKPDRPLRDLGSEASEADVIEQHQAARAQDDAPADEPAMLPADASEADALDQVREVPIEDESRDW